MGGYRGPYRSLMDTLAKPSTRDVDAGEAGGHELGLLRQLPHGGDVRQQQHAREVGLEDLLRPWVTLAHHDDVMAGLHVKYMRHMHCTAYLISSSAAVRIGSDDRKPWFPPVETTAADEAVVLWDVVGGTRNAAWPAAAAAAQLRLAHRKV